MILRGDVVYAQYEAEVVSRGKEAITVHVKDRDGRSMTKFKLAPSDDTIKVNDRDTKFRDVEKGAELRFCMPHKRCGLYANPEGSPLTVLSSEPMQSAASPVSGHRGLYREARPQGRSATVNAGKAPGTPESFFSERPR